MAALKILLAHPDSEWLAASSSTLESAGYQVVAADNGKKAQILIGQEKFFTAIISELLQNHTGAQVLKFAKSNSTGLTITFLAEEFEGDKWIKLGAKHVMPLDSKIDDVLKLIEGGKNLNEMLAGMDRREGVSDEVEVSEDDGAFTKLKIAEFYSSKAVLFDVYVQLGSGRYVKILHAGDTFTQERIDKYKNEKKVEYLWFKASDRAKYLKYQTHLAAKIVAEEKVGVETKAKFLKNVTSKFIEEVLSEGLKPQVIEQGKEICEQVYRFIEKEKNLYKLLRSYQDFDPGAFDHAYLVTLFSTSIIKQFEWQSQSTIETASMACMFHDIGKMKMPKNMLDKRPGQMTSDELEMYRNHTILGAEMVDGNNLINNSVKQIIIQHHEYYDGTGFPFGKKGSKILTLANIVCLVDDFVHSMIEKNIKPTEALKLILMDPSKVARYNSVIVENFIKVFVEPDKIKKMTG